MQTHPDPGEAWSDAATPQPAPHPGQTDVLPLVLADLEARAQLGLRKYGTPLQVENGRDALVDAYQESLDLVMYIKQELCGRGQIVEPKYDLGTKVRLTRSLVTSQEPGQLAPALVTDVAYRVCGVSLCWLERCSAPFWRYTVCKWEAPPYAWDWICAGLAESELQPWEDQTE